jgi:hypothetical protein
MSFTNLQVVPLTKSWTFSIDEAGQRGTRLYLEASYHPSPGGTAVALPCIYDKWSTDFPLCLARNISVRHLGDNDLCGREFTVTYDSRASDFSQGQTNDAGQTVGANEFDFPLSADVNAEVTAWEKPNGAAATWFWSDTGDPIEGQPIFKFSCGAEIKLLRVIYANKLDDFFKLSLEYVGKVNDDVFLGIPEGLLLYRGANLTEFRDLNGAKRWRAELVFALRVVKGDLAVTAGTQNDGWNYILRESDGEWEVPVNGAGAPLYDNADFRDLLDLAKPTVRIPNLLAVTN